MTEDLAKQISELGLNEREAKVYLAALELGPSPVQKIAQRSGVARATTYLVLDDLQDKGFITTYEEGKKSFFTAESPERLSEIVAERETEIKEQRTTVDKLIPELLSRGQFEKGDKPVVRYYEGSDAVKSFIRDSLSGRGGEVLDIAHLDRAKKTLEEAELSLEKIKQHRVNSRIKSRVIYTAQGGPVDGYANKDRQVKYISPDKYPLEADLSVRDDRVYMIPYGTPLRGVAIEDKKIAKSFKMIFELLWAHLPEK